MTGTLSSNEIDAVLLDLDGVITDTARIHAAAWKQLFDGFLAERAERDGTPLVPFDAEGDYLAYVDGKPRYRGVESFLASRGIELPEGSPDDGPDAGTICGLGNRKDAFFNRHLEQNGVQAFPTTVRFIEALRAAGIKTAVVSSSRNCRKIVASAGIQALFDTVVDGTDSDALGLKGKPEPDSFLEAARRLEVEAGRAVVVEDAIAGVQAGRAGRFAMVIGVDQADQADQLRENGADLVVTDLSTIRVESEGGKDRLIDDLPSAFENAGKILEAAGEKKIALFLDYDGTLTPIVARPELAILSDQMRATLRNLAGRCTVAVVSGRDLPDVRKLVSVDNLFYAGSHGFDIAGPGGFATVSEHGAEYLPILDQAERELRKDLAAIEGSLVERKHLSIATHYRLVSDAEVPAVTAVVERVKAAHPELRKTDGKKVYELQPDIDWHKGKAVLWLLQKLGLDGDEVLPIYIGDDITDEDAFRALQGRGLGIIVRDANRPTAADYQLDDPVQVGRFFEKLIEKLNETATWTTGS